MEKRRFAFEELNRCAVDLAQLCFNQNNLLTSFSQDILTSC